MFESIDFKRGDKVRVYNIRSKRPLADGTYLFITESGKIRLWTGAKASDYSPEECCFLGPKTLKYLDRDGNMME